MAIMMGVMMVLMVTGLFGHGHHGQMTGDQVKEDQKEEIVIKEQAKEPPVIGSEKSEEKQEESGDEQYRNGPARPE